MAHRVRQMLFIHDHRAEPALPQMPRPAMACVDISRVTAMRVGEGAPQSVGVGGDDDQMHMVRHRAIAPDLGLGPVRRFGEQIAVQLIVLVVEEGRLAPIAALRHMARKAWKHQAVKTRHASHIAKWDI